MDVTDRSAPARCPGGRPLSPFGRANRWQGRSLSRPCLRPDPPAEGAVEVTRSDNGS